MCILWSRFYQVFNHVPSASSLSLDCWHEKGLPTWRESSQRDIIEAILCTSATLNNCTTTVSTREQDRGHKLRVLSKARALQRQPETKTASSVSLYDNSVYYVLAQLLIWSLCKWCEKQKIVKIQHKKHIYLYKWLLRSTIFTATGLHQHSFGQSCRQRSSVDSLEIGRLQIGPLRTNCTSQQLAQGTRPRSTRTLIVRVAILASINRTCTSRAYNSINIIVPTIVLILLLYCWSSNT